jgi:hypothetical protein
MSLIGLTFRMLKMETNSISYLSHDSKSKLQAETSSQKISQNFMLLE